MRVETRAAQFTGQLRHLGHPPHGPRGNSRRVWRRLNCVGYARELTARRYAPACPQTIFIVKTAVSA